MLLGLINCQQIIIPFDNHAPSGVIVDFKDNYFIWLKMWQIRDRIGHGLVEHERGPIFERFILNLANHILVGLRGGPNVDGASSEHYEGVCEDLPLE